MANKAEKFIKRCIDESFYRIDKSDERESLICKVWFQVDEKLGKPVNWPIEYKNAFRKLLTEKE